MGDTIVFMSAYATTEYSSTRWIFKRRLKFRTLLEKYHMTYIVMGDKLMSCKGGLQICANYDYVQQKTSYTITPSNKKRDIKEYSDVVKNIESYVKLLHAKSVLADSSFFKVDYFIDMEPLLVHIDERVFQIDPMIFSMNNIMIVAFEAIDYQTGIPLDKDNIFGKRGNYNLLRANEYSYFDDENTTPSGKKISEIIYNNVSNFFLEVSRGKLVPENHSFVHDTLVLSNEITDVSDYFCKLVGTIELPSPLVNISTTENYRYYPQDGVSVITNFNSDDVDVPLYNGILLEAIKLIVFLSQYVYLDTIEDLSKVIRSNLYLESLLLAPNVPIETHNLLGCIYKTKTYQNHSEAIRLKISYLTVDNESKKNKNSTILNILLYFVTLIGAIGTLDTLEYRLNIPFKYSCPVVAIVFATLGIIWLITEWLRNKRF